MRPRVLEVIGVYNANGSLPGEIAYVLGKLVGARHCALCDITHGAVRRRPAFDEAARSLGVPFELVHLDEMTDEVAAAVGDEPPRVLARTDAGLVVLADAAALASCGKDPARLVALLAANAAALGIDLGLVAD